jgi:hypothetical protein
MEEKRGFDWRSAVEKAKEWLRAHPAAAFVGGLALVVSLAAAWGGAHQPAPKQAQQAQKPAVQAQSRSQVQGQGQQQQNLLPAPGGGIMPVAVGPVEAKIVQSFTVPTLSSVLPQGTGVSVVPVHDPWSHTWGFWGKKEEVDPKSATVTLGLGSRFSTVSFTVGFGLDAAKNQPESERRGGRYELYADSRKVWEKTLRPDDVAAGRAADERVTVDAAGANALTLRVAALHRQRDKYSWDATVPYSVVLYGFDFAPAQAGGQGR